VTSQAIRDPLADHLITPQNAALVLIDYQPSQFATVRSMDQDLLRENIVSTVKTARAFGLPIVHSTVNVASGQQQPTVPELAELLDDSPPLDRTIVNSWEDGEFVQAVHATGRRKLIFCALWTEVCMAFAALDALREGYGSIPSSTRSAARRSTPIAPGSSGPSKPARSRSAGYRSPASYSATGRASTRFQRSSRSCSPTAC
jgi:hypothetical protein